MKNKIPQKNTKLVIVHVAPYAHDVICLLNGDIDDAINLCTLPKFTVKGRSKVNLVKLQEYKAERIKAGVDENSTKATTYPLPFGTMVIFKEKCDDQYTVLHEAVHVITGIFDKKGVPISEDNTESLAYHIEDFVYQFNKNKRYSMYGKD